MTSILNSERLECLFVMRPDHNFVLFHGDTLQIWGTFQQIGATMQFGCKVRNQELTHVIWTTNDHHSCGNPRFIKEDLPCSMSTERNTQD
jgi:hypothetical protein